MLYTELWWKHDKKDFEGVKKTYQKICEILGHSKDAEKIAYHVTNAYLYADLSEKNKKSYSHSLREFLKARAILKINEKVSYAQIKWWQAFRERNYFLTVIYIFKQQFEMVKKINMNMLFSGYYLIRAGFSHSKRDKEKTAFWLSKYWGALLAEFKNKELIPLPI